MCAVINNFETFHFTNELKKECLKTVPKRRDFEIFLLGSFLALFAVIVVYLLINVFTYDYWFYVMLGMVLVIVIAGYLMDRRYSPDWGYYILEIIKEMKGVDTVKLSEFINEGQPFLGANLGNCEKFLKIADGFIKNEVIELVIRGPTIYLKGFEPPPEEKEEDPDEETS